MRNGQLFMIFFTLLSCRTVPKNSLGDSGLSSVSIGVIDQDRIAFDTGILYLNDKEIPFTKADVKLSQIVPPGKYSIGMVLKRGDQVVGSSSLPPCQNTSKELIPGPNGAVSLDVCTQSGTTFATPQLDSEFSVNVTTREGFPFKKGFVCFKPQKLRFILNPYGNFLLEPVISDNSNSSIVNYISLGALSYNSKERILTATLSKNSYWGTLRTSEFLSAEGTIDFAFSNAQDNLTIALNTKDKSGSPIVVVNSKVSADAITSAFPQSQISEFKGPEGNSVKGLSLNFIQFSSCQFDPE